MHKSNFLLIFLVSTLGWKSGDGQELLSALGVGAEPVYPEYGKILPVDFRPSSPVVDSNASVVVLTDIGNAEVEGYAFGWRVKYSRYRRLLIRNKKGMEAAKILLTFDPMRNGSDKLSSLRANTYNLVDGKVIPTKVDTADMFLELKDGELNERFSFPNVRGGSIIEYTYSMYSGSISHIHSWDFQGDYPRLKSDYTVTFPATFNYVVKNQGAFPVTRSLDSVKDNITAGRFNVRTTVYTIHWTMKEVPAMKEEPYITSMDDHIAGIRFQLSEYTELDTRRRIKVMNSWKELNEKLYKDKTFGGVMTTSTHFLRKELRTIVADTAGDLDKAKELFAYVRDHFTTKGREFLSEDDLTVKEIFKARKGSVAEINLMLTAMLRDEGLTADAVVLSTRGNGVINPNYPLTENLNYVVVRLRVGGKEYFLDATEPRIGFGKLPLACYNGYARVVSEQPDSAVLRPDSLVEFRLTSIILSNNDAGDGVSGDYKVMHGYYSSLKIRDNIAKEGEAAYFEDLRKSYPFEVRLADKHIDSLGSYDQPVTVRYKLSFPLDGEDRIYFNPMLAEGMKENSFSAAVRQYPVEMPYAVNELYVLQMEIPKGYELEELPKPMKVKLNEDDGSYEYGFGSDGSSIQFRSRLILKRAFFLADEYQFLRDFYALVAKKQGEVVVFRKKK